jgi:cytidylate kinase
MGVREGTVVAALVVGTIARFLQRKLSFIPPYIFKSLKSTSQEAVSTEENNNGIIVTITREYGSGGHNIGRLLAKELNMDFYDKEIIDRTAKALDFSEEFVSNTEQRLRSGLLQDFMGQGEAYRSNPLPQDKLYIAEADIIREIADKGNCVIVGRCADYILKNYKNCIKIFLYTDDDTKTREIMSRENLNYDEAYKHMSTINKERYRHYKYYTGRYFGLSTNYSLALDTGDGVENTVKVIKTYIEGCCNING